MRCTLLITLALVAAPLLAQPPKRAPVAPQGASIPLPPIAIAGMVMEGAQWSGDGRYLLAEKADMGPIDVTDMDATKPIPSIVLWNAQTRKTTDIWRGSAGNARVDTLDWIGPSSFAVAVIAVIAPGEDPARHLLRIDARRSGAEDLGVLGQSEMVYASPMAPAAALVAPVEGGVEVRRLLPSGTLSAPSRVTGVGAFPSWSQDGKVLCFLPARKGKDDLSKPVEPFATFDLSTGATGTTTAKPGPVPQRQQPNIPLKLLSVVTSLSLGKASEQISPLWIQFGPEAAAESRLLSPDADWHAVSPTGDAIAFTSRGTLFVAPLLKMDANVMEKAREAARNAMAASNAKQVALALMMYAMDHDDAWPSGDTDLATTLDPYSKTQDIFKDFHYLPPGGMVSEVESPATKVIGWLPAPAGFAVTFADGHVQILPELPKD